MKQPQIHHHVDFASRYSGVRLNTLNAFAAIWRAESLVADAEALDTLKTGAEAKDVPFGLVRSTYEIVNYFAVGYITCLEWHARSRLVDLMLFRPALIETSDVKNLAQVALSQMVAEGVTVPHLLGAATNVSRIKEYTDIFKRVFNGLGITEIIEGELRNQKTEIDLYVEGADNSLYGVLDELFLMRNRLVHEVGFSVVAHHSLRDLWGPSRAVEFGKAVVNAMKLVEAKITQHAPKEFPNRLTAEGYPEDSLEMLKAEVAKLEVELNELLAGWEDVEVRWIEALKAAKVSQEKEFEFLENSEFLRPVSHIDLTRVVEIEYMRARLNYLKILKSQADL